MFWDKKEKDNGLPDLPPLPSTPPRLREDIPSEDEDDEEVHELPSFPDSPMQKGFSQSAIKEAVANEDIKDSDDSWKMPPKSNYEIVESEEWSPKPLPKIGAVAPIKRDTKPIFVRIDKFQLARNSLEAVKTKLNEVEDLLKSIREIKAKEDAELAAWGADLENIKSRVQGVVTDIFEKVD